MNIMPNVIWKTNPVPSDKQSLCRQRNYRRSRQIGYIRTCINSLIYSKMLTTYEKEQLQQVICILDDIIDIQRWDLDQYKEFGILSKQLKEKLKLERDKNI